MEHEKPDVNSKDKPQDHNWVLFRENIRPIRSGSPISLSEAREKFDVVIMESEHLSDPINLFVEYFDWFERNFPSGKCTYITEVLTITIDLVGKMKKYMNDDRLLSLWFKLTEYSKDPIMVFTRAYHSGSCRTLAKFYIRWSEAYEIMGNYTAARRVLDKGFANKAMPISLLNEAKDELELRIFRSALDKPPHGTSDDTAIVRTALGSLSKNEDTLPVVRISSPLHEGLSSNNPLSKTTVENAFDVMMDEEISEETENVYQDDDKCAELIQDLARVKLTENVGDRSSWSEAQIVSLAKAERRTPTFEVLNDEGTKMVKRNLKSELCTKLEDVSPEEYIAEKLGYIL